MKRWGRLTYAHVYLTAGWQYNKPEDDRIVLDVTINEYDKTPRGGETAAHERLAESLLDVWSTLPETARLGITDVRMDWTTTARQRKIRQIQRAIMPRFQ